MERSEIPSGFHSESSGSLVTFLVCIQVFCFWPLLKVLISDYFVLLKTIALNSIFSIKTSVQY